MMKLDHKGFTLVELVVALAIVSLLLIGVGKVFVDSTNIYNGMVNDVSVRQYIDEIDDLLDSYLQDATYVYVGMDQPQYDGQLHNLYIQDDQFYVDDQLFFENDYTNCHFDFSFQLNNNHLMGVLKGEYIDGTTYEKDYFLDLVNVSQMEDSSMCQLSQTKIWFDTQFIMTGSDEEPDDNEDEDIGLPEVPDDVEDDSVDYEIIMGNSFGNTDGFFSGSQSMMIFKGTLLFNPLDGYWYQACETQWVSPDNFTETGVKRPELMRKIDPTYHDASDTSRIFFKGDIIDVDIEGYMPNGQGWEEKTTIKGKYKLLADRADQSQRLPGTYGWSAYWEKVDDSTPLKMASLPNDEIPDGNKDSVYHSLEDDLKNPLYQYLGVYDENQSYDVGDIVKIVHKAKYGADYVTYYRKIFDYDAAPEKTDSNGKLAWQAYSRKFSYTSAYEVGDIVWAYNGYDSKHYRFLKNYDTIKEGDANNWMVYKSFEDGYTEKLDIQ